MIYTALFIGLRAEHFLVFALVIFLCYGSPKMRLFLRTGFPVWIFGACYDSLRLIPAHWKPEIHVADLYHAEKVLFGFSFGGTKLILPEYFITHNTAILDLVCGALYLTHFPVFFLFLVYLFFRDVEKAQSVAWTFLILNTLGMLTFHLYPAAPPWYVTHYGFGPADWNTPAHPAGTLRLDALLGTPVCQGFYRKSPDVFGAVPSLHVAIPALIFSYSRHLSRLWALGSFLYVSGVAFSAVYFNHHYIIDIVVALVYTAITYVLWERLTQNS